MEVFLVLRGSFVLYDATLANKREFEPLIGLIPKKLPYLLVLSFAYC